MEPHKTPLHSRHKERGAKMVEFGGWSMPLWYPSGAVAEHRAVITNAGIFDTCHMSVVMIAGRKSFDLLQYCFSRDLAGCVGRENRPLEPGRAVYGAFLDEQGWVLDDAVLYQLMPDSYMVVVNAGMGADIAGRLKDHSDPLDVRIVDLTGQVGKIDLQGRHSARILMEVLDHPESFLPDMRYFSFTGHFDVESGIADRFFIDKTPVLLSRSGYTGEFGFEILVGSEHVVKVWEMIVSAGETFGLIPCGLAARDSLRAGAMLPLSHQDIGPWPFINHPWSFALPFNEQGTEFTKTFLGDRVLEKRDKTEYTHAFVGYDPRKVSIGDPAVVLNSEEERIGEVLTCVSDMAVARHRDRIYSMGSPDKPVDFKPSGLICGFIRTTSKLNAGRIVELKDKRRKVRAMVVDDIRPDRTARRSMREMI